MKRQFFFRKPFKYTFFNAVLWIIAVNVLFFICTTVWPHLKIVLSLNIYYLCFNQIKMLWQPVTYMFTHGSFLHLLFNMWVLYQIGGAVERAIGSKEFLIFYFVTGILSGLLSLLLYLLSGMWQVFLLGASGAIYGLLLAYAVLYPKAKLFIWGLIPVSAPLLVIVYALIEILSGIDDSVGVAHSAHLFGILVAWLYFVIRFGVHPVKVWIEAYRRK